MLILDEATSSLDSTTERIFQESLRKNLREKTMIIIAHRVSTLQDVDRIYVMEEGRIVEEGNYLELIENPKSKFFQIYSTQQKKKII
jgi:ABC-type multidrug transport system fused ATPase/permease subunit